MPNLAMRQPATMFSGDGLDLSWPLGGEREVVSVPDEDMSIRIKRRIAEGSIAIVDDKPTKSADGDARVYRLLTGDEARKHFAEPAGPVTRVVYQPAVPEDEREYQLEVQSAQMDSPRFLQAQEERAKAAEEDHAALTKRQVEAEKKAAADAKKDAAEDDEPDILTARLKTTEASAEWHANNDKAFMEREKARQVEENEELKHFDKRTKPKTETVAGVKVTMDEPDTSDADKAFMAREKARQEKEAEVDKDRQAAAKEAEKAAKDAEKVADQPYAGKSDPIVQVSPVGVRPGAGVTAADKAKTPDKPKPKA